MSAVGTFTSGSSVENWAHPDIVSITSAAAPSAPFTHRSLRFRIVVHLLIVAQLDMRRVLAGYLRRDESSDGGIFHRDVLADCAVALGLEMGAQAHAAIGHRDRHHLALPHHHGLPQHACGHRITLPD